MEKSKQKPLVKSKAIFNLIFLKQKIKTADKINANASKANASFILQLLLAFIKELIYCLMCDRILNIFHQPNSFAVQ
ncbi:MAG: hypothetical protein IPF58_14880 [Saprospirales bacterium]|nr:hypothetical protein [Saprospirales bacterium]